MFPNTIILGMNLHGEIKLNNEEKPEIKQIPPNIKNIIQLNVVAPGVPNISRMENYNKLLNLTEQFVHNNTFSSYPNKEELIDYVKHIQQILISESKAENHQMEKYYKQLLTKNGSQKEIQKFENYIYSLDKTYMINSYNAGHFISNKLFYKFSEVELRELSEIHTNFNKIVIYNDEKMDVFELIKFVSGVEINEISLFDLIDFFVGVGGVENIIFIDMSCSIIKNSNNIVVNDRKIRAIRREIEQL